MLGIQLWVEGDNLGPLNLYSRRVDAFDDECEQVGLLFDSHAAVEARVVPMPDSTSFPQGHASSAFAYAVGRDLPELAVPIRLLAGGVAYSRVHTGVHYTGDVVIGALVGAGGAAMIGAAGDRAFQAGWREGLGLG